MDAIPVTEDNLLEGRRSIENGSFTTSSVVEGSIGKSLNELNEEEAQQYIGGVVFVTLVMVTGIVGNIHVLLVYAFRMKPSNHRIFILFLGVLDITTCLIGMPFIIVDLRNPLTFTLVSACKLLRFVNYFICSSSALILLVIAVDRYRKICVPLGRQLTQKVAKFLCLLVLGVALVISWPAPTLYGHSTVEINNGNVTGVRCYTEDRFKKTKYMAYFNAVLILVVFGVFGVLVVLYSFIGRAIAKHSQFKSAAQDSRVGASTSRSADIDVKDSGIGEESPMESTESDCSEGKRKMRIIETTVSTGPSSVSDVTSASAVQENIKSDKVAHEKSRRFDRVKRTTFMLFLITAVFFMSYVPHLVLKIITFAKKDFVANMTFSGKVLYNTFIWCFFVNNMANCIIYGFCDTRFRTEVKLAYKRCIAVFK